MNGKNLMLVLDIGGVFYRGWPESAFWSRWSERTGRVHAELEAILAAHPALQQASRGQLGRLEAYAAVGEALGLPAEEAETFLTEAFLSDFNERFAKFVLDLRKTGMPVWALTNSTSSAVEIAQRPGLTGLFDQIVSSRDVGLAKPDPAIFALLLHRLGRPPESVLFVDDNPGHLLAAARLGMRTCHFVTTESAMSAIRAAVR